MKHLFSLLLLLSLNTSFAAHCTWQNNATHLDLSICLEKEFKIANSQLINTYLLTFISIDKDIKDLKNLGAPFPTTLRSQLTVAYVTFLLSRDSLCNFIGTSYLPGNGGGVAQLSCMIDLTNTYIHILKKYST